MHDAELHVNRKSLTVSSLVGFVFLFYTAIAAADAADVCFKSI